MYHDIMGIYWWDEMKNDTEEFVAQCPNCQQVKIEHQKPDGLLQAIEISTWTWEIEVLSLHLISRGPSKKDWGPSYHSSIQMAQYEALYRRKCKAPIGWFEVGETKLVGPELVQQTVENIKLIRERLLVAQSRQKFYADNRLRDLDFQVTEQLSYEKAPIAILDRQVQRLRTKDVVSVNVLWISNNVEEMTREAEEAMKTRYPHLFPLS
ncbi:uncharacterized protein [Nicotiana tomentosiformis]|uniref:uncharacterized protein n=1 Tax=Nicotiana tomentosiformis TaxID=4098 RepID=UPI00388C55F0